MRSRFLALAVAVIAISACGSTSSTSSSGGSSGSGTTETKDATIASEVPSAVSSKSTFVVAADASYAPNEFVDTDGSTVVGMDADLAKALGQIMGLNVEIKNVKFDDIIPGIQGGKYDMGASSFTDTKAREEVVDFVTYFSAGTSFFVTTSGPTINSLDDLCGHKVSVETGTTQADDANAQKTKCTDAGKADVTVLSFPDQNATNLALQSGRAEVSMADSPVAAYQVKQSDGKFKLTGSAYGTAPYGLALPKNGMTKAVKDALKKMIDDGVYANILKKWGVEAGAITSPEINQGS
jgi:polar amino acid transport system substrate-binding protein